MNEEKDLKREVLEVALEAANEHGITLEKMRLTNNNKTDRDRRNAALWQVRKQFAKYPAKFIAKWLDIPQAIFANAIEAAMKSEANERKKEAKWEMPGTPAVNYLIPQAESRREELLNRQEQARERFFTNLQRPTGAARQRKSLLDSYAMAEF